MVPSNNFVFRIPDRIEELVDSDNFPDYYLVKAPISPDEIPRKIGQADTLLKSNGPDFIFETFDTFYYTIQHFSTMDSNIRDEAFVLLYKSLTKLQNQLTLFFENFQMNDRLYYQNKLQMIMYAFVQMCERFEDDIADSESGKKKKKISTSDLYQSSKRNYLTLLLKIFSMRLDRLFVPAHFLNSFVNVVTKFAYKIVETQPRLKGTVPFQLICEIIDIAIEKYDHVLSYCMKIIELLQTKESLVGIVASLVTFNIKQNNHYLLISHILVQIKSIDINELSRDSSAPRAISAFLVEIAQQCTEQMFKCITDLLEFLEQDSYLLRNAALEIISIIIIKMLRMPKLQRDGLIKRKLMENLENHIHDVTSYTRSKVLHLWCNLLQNDAIPISHLNRIIQLAIGRLDDKSCFVRKYAVQFLSLTLKENPFKIMNKKELSKLLKIVETKRKECYDKYESLCDSQSNQVNEILNIGQNLMNEGDSNDPDKTLDQTESTDPDDSSSSLKRKSESFEKSIKKQKIDTEDIVNHANIWADLEKSFLDFWKKKGSELNLDEDFPDDIPQESFKDALDFYIDLVIGKDFQKALKVLFALKSLYPTEDVFKLARKPHSSNDDNNGNDENNDSQPESQSSSDMHFDNIFILSTINFSSKLNENLPYELSLARNAFLAPIHEWGRTECEKKDNSDLINIINKKNEELLHNSETVNQIKELFLQYDDLFKRFHSALEFHESISISVPKISILLNSRNSTDVQEAISFFKYAFRMEIENAIVGIQKMLKLIFTKEKAVKEALLEAFVEIYLKDSKSETEVDDNEDAPGNHKKSLAAIEIRNLSNMILKLNQGELICAETLIQQLYEAKKFDQIHLRVLWERYAMKLANTSPEESRAALIIIGMIASAEPTLVRNDTNMNNIITVSLEERKDDYRLVADTCNVLLKTFKIPATESMEQFYKLQPDNVLFQKLKNILTNSITNTSNSYWYLMASSIIKVIYYLSEKPDYTIAEIIHKCHDNITKSAKDPENKTVSDVSVGYFIFLLGEIAVCLLNHLDLHVMKEIKIRQFIKEKDLNSKKQAKSTKGKRKSSSKSDKSMVSNEDDDDGLGPNNNEDPYQEQISKICNEEVLFESGILSKYTGLVESIASDYFGDKYSLRVRRSACLTMAKFMTLSMKYTRKNRVILADVLEKSKDCTIRSNAIISFGDLLLRFPNEIEHYTGKIFSCLEDKDFQVKSNSLKVLSRLVLADMIKPKGHISKIAALVTDPESSISSPARLFFVELGKKNNAYIYNFLPDIISNLSGSKGLPENRFQEMITFLFELLEKSRNTESLVTKLCSRFNNTNDERTWRDLSFCLSQLQYNDRAFYNLMNCFNLFSDTLYCDSIYENITSIVANVRKAGNLKQEMKVMLDEMENKIAQVRSKGASSVDMSTINTANSTASTENAENTEPDGVSFSAGDENKNEFEFKDETMSKSVSNSSVKLPRRTTRATRNKSSKQRSK